MYLQLFSAKANKLQNHPQSHNWIIHHFVYIASKTVQTLQHSPDVNMSISDCMLMSSSLVDWRERTEDGQRTLDIWSKADIFLNNKKKRRVCCCVRIHFPIECIIVRWFTPQHKVFSCAGKWKCFANTYKMCCRQMLQTTARVQSPSHAENRIRKKQKSKAVSSAWKRRVECGEKVLL